MFPRDLTNDYPGTIQFLTGAILKNTLANSYVLIGRDSVPIATHLSKILNCSTSKNNYTDPCENCINCKWISKNEHPHALQIIRAEASSKKEQIKVEVIRELLNFLSITSEFFRVIYFEKSSLTVLPKECCNMLLKTIEEAPKRTLFIFANLTRHEILPTILSRSQILYVNKNPDTSGEIISKIKVQVPKELISNLFSKNLKDAIEKTNITQKFMNENDIKLKDYLLFTATKLYTDYKYTDLKRFCFLYEKIQTAYLKLNSFMQPKIVLEDLFYALADV